MDPWDPFLLTASFGAALLAGSGNAVAGGGSALSFPILVWLGLPPVAANATNGVGLWPGSAAAAWSYRRRLADVPGGWWWLIVPSVVGGGLGAWLLLALPPSWFERIAPFLVIGAAGLVAVEPMLRRWIFRMAGATPDGSAGTSPAWRWAAGGSQFLVALYGGYFGAGIGILLLSSLGLLGMTDLQRANGFKNLLATTMKGVAVVYFVVKGVLIWPVAVVMAVGSTLGGYATGILVQKVSGRTLRWIVVAVGVAMGASMFFRD